MTRCIQFRKQGTEIATIILFMLMAGFSCFAQESLKSDGLILQEKISNGRKFGPNLYLPVKAVALNSSINSNYNETKPAVALHGTRLYFSRGFHPDNIIHVNDPEDIWYTEFDEKNETWSEAKRLPGELNTEGPTSINSVSITGDTMIYASVITKKHITYPVLSYCVSKNGKWAKPVVIEITNHYNLAERADAYVSLKSGIIIFAVQRKETSGSRDLYVSFWDGLHASEPINLGEVVNTGNEESSPFLASDLKTLYFSSKGHTGYGGYDVFVSRRLDDSWIHWSKPENLGPVVNGAKDEEFFMITHCKRFAFFSKEISPNNSDLYRIGMDDVCDKKPSFR